jgi:hypothetical protein
MVLSGHFFWTPECPLSGVKRTSVRDAEMSAYDPKRTLLPLRPIARQSSSAAASEENALLRRMWLPPLQRGGATSSEPRTEFTDIDSRLGGRPDRALARTCDGVSPAEGRHRYYLLNTLTVAANDACPCRKSDPVGNRLRIGRSVGCAISAG